MLRNLTKGKAMNKPFLLNRYDEESPMMYELLSADADQVAGAGKCHVFTVPQGGSGFQDRDEEDGN